MIDVQFTTDELKSGLQDHVLLLAEVERGEADETLRPVIAAQRAVQAARLAAMEAHLTGDRNTLIESLCKIGLTTAMFYLKAGEWRPCPLPTPLVERMRSITKQAADVNARVSPFYEQWRTAVATGSGCTPTVKEAQDMEHIALKEGMRIAALQYDLALDILQYRMNATDPDLH